MDSLALLEIASIARGYRVLDALVKESPVRVIEANHVEPGKYLILFGGGVAEVEAAHLVGKDVAGDTLVDEVLLAGVDPRIWAALAGARRSGEFDTVGIVEGTSIARVLYATERSLKNAAVALTGLRIDRALGGRAYYVVDGNQPDVDAAIEAGVEALGERLVRAERIARPHPDFLVHVLRPAPFGTV